MPTILLTNNYDKGPLEIVKSAVPEQFELLYPQTSEKRELMELAKDADFLLVSGRQKIDAELLESASHLKMIQRTGVGIDMLDLEAIRKKNIPVYINRGVNAQSVAEHTVLLILACLRKLTEVDRNVKAGIWKKQATGICTHELKDKEVGLIGIGEIGKKVAVILKAFGADVFYYDVNRLSYEEEQNLEVMYKDLDTMIAAADILSFHCPLTNSTAGLLSRERLNCMKESAIVVNTARGGLIDQEALYEALRDRRIAFAGLDVYSSEPVKKEALILTMNNVITTPHIGGITRESFYDMISSAIKNIESFYYGKWKDIENKRYEG